MMMTMMICQMCKNCVSGLGSGARLGERWVLGGCLAGAA